MVLHLIASGFFGGPEKQILMHLEEATRVGHPVSVCVFSGKGMSTELADRAERIGIPAFRLDTAGKFDWKSLKLLKEILGAHGVKVLCSHGFKASFYGYVVSKIFNVKLIAFVRGDTTENIKIRIYCLLEKIIIRNFQRIVTLSSAQKCILISRYKIEEERISVVPNSINVDGMECAAVEGGGDLEILEPYFANGPVLLAAGRLSPEKGYDVLIAAMAELREPHRDVCLVILGEGQERNNLEALCKKLGLEDRVLLPGFSLRTPYYMKKAILFVNPSRSEGMPNVVLEARALRVPVVATSVGGVPEIFKDGEGGFLVPPEDQTSLARAIDRILDNPKNSTRVAETGFEEFRCRFKPTVLSRRLIEIYESV